MKAIGKLGPRYLGEGICEFRVWAPLVNEITLHIVSRTPRLIPLEKEEGGYFFTRLTDVQPQERYFYKINDSHERPDPLSQYQPEDIFGPSAIVDHSSFFWQDDNWKGIAWKESVIYELHVGTYTPEGTFAGVKSKLSYLQDLGVNSIEIMPICQFPGQRNWGYDGVYPFAVQNSYGGPEELKSLVNECHMHGISVILDVVYNHLGPEGNFLPEFMPCFSNTYKTPWGEAINFDNTYSNVMRELFIQNTLYWLEQYHIDGLRLDAIHGILDTSAKHFLKELSERVFEFSQAKERSYSLIAESNLNDVRVVLPWTKGGYGLNAQWNDDFHHSLHTLLTKETQGYYEDFGSLEQLAKALREGFVYSWDYSLFRKRNYGSFSSEISPTQFVIFSQNHDQVGNRLGGERLSHLVSSEALKIAAVLVLLSRNIPLLFMGEEYGEESPFLYFMSFHDKKLVKSVCEGRKNEFSALHSNENYSDPFDITTFLKSKLQWDKLKKKKERALWKFYKDLLNIRKENSACTNPDIYEVKTYENAVLSITGLNKENGIFVAINFDETKRRILTPGLQGEWIKIFDSSGTECFDELLVENATLCIEPLHCIGYKRKI